MLSQKPLPVLFIFSFVDRTGRIDQLPARFHIAGGGIKYRILYLRKPFKLFRGLVALVGLFRDDSEPRAWDVTQHPVGFPDEFLPDFCTVLDGDRYYADSEPLRPLLNEGQLAFVKVKAEYSSLVSHAHGNSEALSARAAAGIYDRIAGMCVNRGRAELRRLVLNKAKSIGKRSDVAYRRIFIKYQPVFRQNRFGAADSVIGKTLFQAFAVGFKGIHAQSYPRVAVQTGEDAFALLIAVIAFPHGAEPFRAGIFHRQISGISLLRVFNRILSP